MARRVAVVTDSSAMLPDRVVAEHGIVVVPLQVVVDETAYAEGEPEATPEAVAAALTGRKGAVTTSRPAPAVFAEAYAELAARGFDEVVSVHLSAEMSGTVESARLAARDADVPVVTLDTRAVGPCVGFAVEAAVAAVAEGRGAEAAAAAAIARADATRSYFYVHSLEYLRRGGRIGAAAALLGSALAVKPLLAIEDGHVVVHERVRTAARAIARLEELAVEVAADRPVEVAVAHLDNLAKAELMVEHLEERLATNLGDRELRCGVLGAALGAHAGPGMLAVVVAPVL